MRRFAYRKLAAQRARKAERGKRPVCGRGNRRACRGIATRCAKFAASVIAAIHVRCLFLCLPIRTI
ncbi:hypothetical protein [Treponema endosymbiont of Eucomonympha sp.]|uniref:hypothetical protein n=1 Tax=Treponema endosymbiont of Eucomonympha sp. TaxID=1580831 RepID=UPI0013968544